MSRTTTARCSTPQWSLPAAGGVTDIVPCFSDAHLQTRAACRWLGLGPGWGLWPGDRPAAPGSPSAPGPPESTSLPAGELRAPPSASGSPAGHTHTHKYTLIHTCINEHTHKIQILLFSKSKNVLHSYPRTGLPIWTHWNIRVLFQPALFCLMQNLAECKIYPYPIFIFKRWFSQRKNQDAW